MKSEQFEVNEYIKEYLQYSQYENTFECFEAEIRTKQVAKKLVNPEKLEQSKKKVPKDPPRIFGMMQGEKVKSVREKHLEKDFNTVNNRYTQVSAAAKQVLAVAINAITLLDDLVKGQDNEEILNTIGNFKIQLGKYNNIILSEGKPGGQELYSDNTIQDLKKELNECVSKSMDEAIVENLISFRVNALQVSPEYRDDLVKSFVKNDVLNIQQDGDHDFIFKILENKESRVVQNITSLISYISSTKEGIDYLLPNGKYELVEHISKLVKNLENGTVGQRYCIAILQKFSIKDEVIPVYIKHDLIHWSIELINNYLTKKFHVFCPEFASAMLANIIRTHSTVQYLEKNTQLTSQILESLLLLLRESLPYSVYPNILLALGWFGQNIFSKVADECRYQDRINDFVLKINDTKISANGLTEEDKKYILSLCNEILNPPHDQSADKSIILDKNDNVTNDSENPIVFECFSDEVN